MKFTDYCIELVHFHIGTWIGASGGGSGGYQLRNIIDNGYSHCYHCSNEQLF